MGGLGGRGGGGGGGAWIIDHCVCPYFCVMLPLKGAPNIVWDSKAVGINLMLYIVFLCRLKGRQGRT